MPHIRRQASPGLMEPGAFALGEGYRILDVVIGRDPDAFNFGSVAVGTTPATGLDYFEVENKSSFPIDVYISGTDMVGGVGWTLSDDGNAGADIVGFKAGLEGGSYNIVVKKNSPYNKLVASLGAGSKQKFGLEMAAPTSYSDGEAKSGTITLEGVAV